MSTDPGVGKPGATEPFSLVLHLTQRCNLRCGYCYAGRSLPGEMSLETAELAVRWALGHLEPGQALEVGFFGGEPLLRPELLLRCVELAEGLARGAGRSLRFQATTNGTLLTRELARALAEHRFELTISLDGLPELQDAQRPWPGGVGSSEAALSGLRAALEVLPDTVAAWVVTPAACSRLAEGVGFLAGLGVRCFQMAPELYSDWAEPANQALREGLRGLALLYAEHFDEWSVLPLDTAIARCLPGSGEFGCGFGVRKLAVSASGNLYPCERFTGEDGGSERARSLGNLRQPSSIVWPMPGEWTSCACGPILRGEAPNSPDTPRHGFEQACAEAALVLLEHVYRRRGLPPPGREP